MNIIFSTIRHKVDCSQSQRHKAIACFLRFEWYKINTRTKHILFNSSASAQQLALARVCKNMSSQVNSKKNLENIQNLVTIETFQYVLCFFLRFVLERIIICISDECWSFYLNRVRGGSICFGYKFNSMCCIIYVVILDV